MENEMSVPGEGRSDEAAQIRHIADAMNLLFHRHAELSDFIMKNNGLDGALRELELQAKSGFHGPNHPPSVWLRNFCRAMKDELREVEESIAWKWWRPLDKTDMENVRVEIVDLFHFMVSAAMASGMSGSDFVRIYFKKRQLNFDRQRDGFIKGDNEQRRIGQL